MTHIDTAEMYSNGRVEEIVAAAIKGRRDDVFLASKVLPSNASYQGTLDACRRSLRRLKTGWLDLYLLHWPSDYPIADTIRAMEKLVDDGLIRYFGVSNFDLEELQEAEQALSKHRISLQPGPILSREPRDRTAPLTLLYQKRYCSCRLLTIWPRRFSTI